MAPSGGRLGHTIRLMAQHDRWQKCTHNQHSKQGEIKSLKMLRALQLKPITQLATMSGPTPTTYYTKKHRGGCMRWLLRPGHLITKVGK